MNNNTKRLITIIVCMFIITTAAFSQRDTIPPYKKSPGFPAVRLLLPDSSSYFTKADIDKKMPLMVMLFNPQCEHCKHETEELVKNIEKFKGIQILMATSMSFDSMMAFREKYQLAQHKNITVAYDGSFTLISFFSISQMPTLAFYNRKKEFISIFEGGLPVDKILKELDK